MEPTKPTTFALIAALLTSAVAVFAPAVGAVETDAGAVDPTVRSTGPTRPTSRRPRR